MVVQFNAPDTILYRGLNEQYVAVPGIIFGEGIVLNRGEITRRHKIAGTVRVDGYPAKRNIIAYDRRSMSYVGSAVSDPITGSWDIQGLSEYPERSLLVFALDTTGYYNAEVADYISQVATV